MERGGALRTAACRAVTSGKARAKPKALRISAQLPMIMVYATGWPRSAAVPSEVSQSFMTSDPARRMSTAVSVEVGVAGMGCPLEALVEQQRLSERLDLHGHLLEAGHLLLELEHEVGDIGRLEGLGQGDLVVETGLAELGGRDHAPVGIRPADHLQQGEVLRLAR